MKHLLVAFVTLFLIQTSYGQIQGKKLRESITVFDSIQVNPGDTLHFGIGTDKKGDFVYIYQPRNGWSGTGEYGLQRRFAGKYGIIKFFKVEKDKRTGDKTVAVINPMGGFNMVADLESAITAKEITGINGRSFIKSSEPTVIVQQLQPSMADELRKLKKLYDDSLLTKDEYEVQKKKLLDRK
jgi:hypothetical protein